MPLFIVTVEAVETDLVKCLVSVDDSIEDIDFNVDYRPNSNPACVIYSENNAAKDYDNKTFYDAFVDAYNDNLEDDLPEFEFEI